MASQDSIQSAIEKAKLIAAKLTSQMPSGVKRPAESGDEGGSKKFASIPDVVGAQLAALKAQTSNGSSSNQYTEEYKVPDKLVGLVIGRGGEQITRLKLEAGCNIVISPESAGQPDRVLVLSGKQENVEKAKHLIEEIVKRGTGGTVDLGKSQGLNFEVIEMKIPGAKCGLVIGKSGETIKRLGEQYGVKLVVVQDNSSSNVPEKPLRITGEPDKIAKAKEAVLQLIGDRKPDERGGDGRGGRGGDGRHSTNEYGSRNGGSHGGGGGGGSGGEISYIRVAADKAGIVIGKGGETIKDIIRKSGGHVEIDKNRKEENGDKIFIVKGTPDQIQYAQQLIYDKITGCSGAQVPQGFFGPNAIYAQNAGQYSQWSAYQAWNQSADPKESPNSQAAGASGAGQMDQMAAWAAYYQQYYQQSGATPAAAGATATAAGGAQPSINPTTGQPDYSMAWVEYYRSLGMYAEAEAILKQTQTSSSQNGGTTPTSSSNGNGTTTSTTTTAANAANWQNYAGYQAYSNAYQSQTQ